MSPLARAFSDSIIPALLSPDQMSKPPAAIMPTATLLIPLLAITYVPDSLAL
jgi:hypothetical protein